MGTQTHHQDTAGCERERERVGGGGGGGDGVYQAYSCIASLASTQPALLPR